MSGSKYVSKVEGHALVFGGSGDIGIEVVRALVAYGATTISFTYDRNKQRADALIAELAERGIKSYAASINLSDNSMVNEFLEKAVAHIGEEISVVVNAVGISPNKPLELQTLETVGDAYDDKGWREVFEVNVFGCFISTRAVIERMKAKNIMGSIVLITSTNGINSHSSISVHYDSSKAAQAKMMQVLAEYYSKHVRLNGVAPGWMNTKMNQTLPPEERDKEMIKIWVGRFADPSEVASFIAYVSGTGGSYIYGQNFMIDGGYR